MRDKFGPLLKWHFKTFMFWFHFDDNYSINLAQNLVCFISKFSFPSPLLTLDGRKLLQLSAAGPSKKAICYILSEKRQNKRYE